MKPKIAVVIFLWNKGHKPDLTTVISGLGATAIALNPEEHIPGVKGAGRGRAILGAAKKAEESGMTHIITMDGDGRHNPEDLKHLVKAARKYPHALIVARRRRIHGKRGWKSFFCPPDFWLRLQTGKSLGDPSCGFRVYPLGVINNLKSGERGRGFEGDILARAAWAGVDLREAPVSSKGSTPTGKGAVFSFGSIFSRLYLFNMNIKLAMRSIAPVPHRKIIDARENGHEKISVLRPLRSLRALLTERTTPLELSRACALGVFLGALPLLACHTVVILLACGFFRLNKVAAVAVSQLCMPPLVPAICVEVGYFLRHGKFLTEISMQTLGYEAPERLYEWALGSLIFGPAMAVAIGFLVYILTLAIKAQKDVRVQE